jgi:transcriptional regulator with XRE-family HTH domain
MTKISLAAARVNKKLTQKQLAKKMGVCNLTVIKWESGKSCPSGRQLQELSRLFDIPMDMINLD